jgi:hypothetical protein
MAGPSRRTIALALAAGLVLAASPFARAQRIVDQKETWIISNRGLERFEQVYGDVQNISLEELCVNTGPEIHGAIRTRGILMAGPRPQSTSGSGQGQPSSPSGPGATAPRGPQGPSTTGANAPPERTYSLGLPTDRRLTTGIRQCGGMPIRPGLVVEKAFEFEVDSLNLREIEVIGTFEAPVGSDQSGPSAQTALGEFWFWAYSVGPTKTSRAGARAGLLALEDLVSRPDRLAGETVKVVGQFRGKNLFRDLDDTAVPDDGWVIKDGAFAVWVTGKKPKGSGFRLDPASRSDTARWVQVTGTLDRKGKVTRLKAIEVALVAPPRAAPEP